MRSKLIRLLAIVLVILPVAPATASALSLSVPRPTRTVCDVVLDVTATDTAGVATLFVDGSPVRSINATPSMPATFTKVVFTPGVHKLSALVRSADATAEAAPITLTAWPSPPRPRLLSSVPKAGLVKRTVKLKVAVGAAVSRIRLLVNRKSLWSRSLSSASTVFVTVKLPPGQNTVELRAENPVGRTSRTLKLTSAIWPVPGHHDVGSRFGPRWGRMHKGIDIHAPYGARVVAAAAGRVIWARPLTTYGGLVMIDHGGGMTTYYAHLSSISVKYGQRVTIGQRIGRVGIANVAHLHFQLFTHTLGWSSTSDMYRRVNSGIPVDPFPYVGP